MDCNGRIDERCRKIRTPKTIFFTKLVRHKFQDHPGVYESFLFILFEYTYGRIEHDNMYQEVSILFSAHPQVLRVFRKCYPQAMFTEVADVDASRPAKRSKIEDDCSKTVFHSTSNANTSYASNYSQSPCSNGCYPLEEEAVASCSSSSPSRPGNAAEAYDAKNNEIAAFIGGTLYLTETKTRLVDGPQAYEHLRELVNQIAAKRIDTYVIMERASNLLQGYPELLESFNAFLPEGFIVIVFSDDYEMNTDSHGRTG